MHRDVEVQRLPNPDRRGRARFIYMDALSQWLRKNRDAYDIAFVSMLKHSAYSAVTVCRKQRQSVVLRVEGGGDTRDCRQLASYSTLWRPGFVVDAKVADTVIAPSQATR